MIKTILKAIFLIAMLAGEGFAIYLAIFIKDYAIRSNKREIELFNNNLFTLVAERLLAGVVIATILSGILLAILALVKAINSTMINFRLSKFFLWQWIILFIATMIGFAMDLFHLSQIANINPLHWWAIATE